MKTAVERQSLVLSMDLDEVEVGDAFDERVD